MGNKNSSAGVKKSTPEYHPLLSGYEAKALDAAQSAFDTYCKYEIEASFMAEVVMFDFQTFEEALAEMTVQIKKNPTMDEAAVESIVNRNSFLFGINKAMLLFEKGLAVEKDGELQVVEK